MLAQIILNFKLNISKIYNALHKKYKTLLRQPAVLMQESTKCGSYLDRFSLPFTYLLCAYARIYVNAFDCLSTMILFSVV